ncbi:MAG: hypothetical protein IPM63_10980 [Acidobacteriota bacterium]|nr:MAG: hypothetical protein IPM63_10980 [Acidobacteriota bacterium]
MNICPPPHFIDFFRSPFVYMVLVASVAASCAVLVTRPVQKFERYSIETEMFQRLEPTPVEEKEQFEFVFYCVGRNRLQVLEVADDIGDVVMTLLFLFPAVTALIFTIVITTLIPGLDPVHYQAAASVSFIFYTSYYWLSIGYLIYNTPGDWGPFREDLKMLSILDDGKR